LHVSDTKSQELSDIKSIIFSAFEQIIKVPANVSKNKSDRIATIPNSLMMELEKWDFNGAEKEEYIFGKNLLPGKEPLDARRFTKKWDKLRDDLCLDSKIKLYSLRDSGIVQMLQDGISPEEVMKQADHSSLDITTIYVKHANPTGSEQIKNKSSNF